jgi:hypothetical protein
MLGDQAFQRRVAERLASYFASIQACLRHARILLDRELQLK